jgi:SAM-dependent methyltransferase
MPSVAQHFPEASNLKNDTGVDLIICQCTGCGLVQLNTEPVPYFRDVIRAAAFSPEMGAFRKTQLSAFIKKYSLTGKRLLEAGCGCGEYLELLQECGGNAFGVEHNTASVEFCIKKKLQVQKDFIDSPLQKIKHGPFDAFFTFNFLEHLPDPNSFLQGVANNLLEGSIGLVEVPNFDMILRERMASEFMRDHLFYFTKRTLGTTLALNGFEVLECGEVWHSYILSAEVRKRSELGLDAFHEHQRHVKHTLDEYLAQFPSLSVAVWGAGHQALAIFAFAELNGKVKYVVDQAPFKQGRFTPATHIPIVSPESLSQDGDLKAVIVMGASYSDEIVQILLTKHRQDLSIAVLRAHGLEVVRQGSKHQTGSLDTTDSI